MNDTPPPDVTDGAPAGTSVDWEDDVSTEDLAQVREIFVSLGKAIRAHQLYDENNPVYQRFISGLRKGFSELWQRLEGLSVQVEEDRLLWLGEEVYRSDSRSDSIAFLFYKDGVREVAFEPGIEEEELTRLLDVLQRARNLRPESDDLLTILWDEDLQHFEYHHVDLLAQGVELPVPGEGNDQEELQRVLEEEVQQAAATEEEEEDAEEAGEAASPSSSGPVSTEDFNPTLYSLDPKEMEKLQQEVQEEMDRDLRRAVLAALFDRLEEPDDRERQSEILGIFRTLLPNFLSRGALRPAAAVLHELDSLRKVEGILDEERQEEADGLLVEVSSPEVVEELVRALRDGSIRSDSRSLGTLLQFLRPRALGPLLRAAETEEDTNVQNVLRESVRALAERHRNTVSELLDSDDPVVMAGAARLAGQVGIEGAASRLGRLLQHDAAEVRLAAIDAAVSLRASSAASALEDTLEDREREVRIAAARALGTLSYEPAAARFRELLKGTAIRQADVTEMIAVFESYGDLGDPEAVPLLDKLLNGKGLLGRKESEDIRACAALALGRVGTPEARSALEKAQDQQEPVVRSAVNRALKGGAE